MACRTRVRHDTGELPGHGPGTHRRVCSICAFLQVSGPGWGVCLLNREKEPRRQIWQIYEKFLGSETAVTTWVCSQETGSEDLRSRRLPRRAGKGAVAQCNCWACL